MTLGAQVVWLLLLALPVASVVWTVTHEEVLREPREYCQRCSRECRSVLARKFFYLFTCEYCFSHYITLAAITLTGFKLLLNDWRGYVLAFFAVVWMANVYMGVFGRLRLEIRKERVKIDEMQEEKKILEKDAA